MTPEQENKIDIIIGERLYEFVDQVNYDEVKDNLKELCNKVLLIGIDPAKPALIDWEKLKEDWWKASSPNRWVVNEQVHFIVFSWFKQAIENAQK